MKRISTLLLSLLLALCLPLSGCGEAQVSPAPGSSEPAVSAAAPAQPEPVREETATSGSSSEAFEFELPEVSDGEAYTIVNGNLPYFTESDYTTEAFETYSELDELGRCGAAYANICTELMPTESREDIGSVHPSGWQSVQYDFVDGQYLYNRCHLIGFQLAGENANEQNLITGTRYLNIAGMLPFENEVADYAETTGNHVLYRVTPDFEGDELVARGVLMEGWSVEDEGEGVCFCVYAYNIQPGVEIDYATGESREAGGYTESSGGGESSQTVTVPDGHHEESHHHSEDHHAENCSDYVLNTSSHKFHFPDCSGAANMSPDNRQDYTGTRDEVLSMGYDPCGICNP